MLAFSLLAVLQWGAAMFTAIYFRAGSAGDWAALFAAALLAGSAYAAGRSLSECPQGGFSF